VLRNSQGRARALAALGLIAALVFLGLLSRDPTGTLSGGHTDHVAHIGEARAVTVVGLRLWQEPAATLFKHFTDSELETLPEDLRTYARTEERAKDVHKVASFDPQRPLVMNFAHVPRCYPPGVFLVSLPSALAFHFGWTSFSGANRWFLALLALAWFFAVFAWTAHWNPVSSNERVSAKGVLRELLTVSVAAYVWYWAMEGFYDVAAVALASWAQVFAQRRARLPYAALFWGLAVIVHSRMLALLPLAMLSTIGAALQWRTLARIERACVVLGATLLVGALGYAIAIQPIIALHAAAQPKNILRPGSDHPLVVVLFAVMLVVLVWRLWREHARIDAVMVLFMGLAFGSQRYLTSWYWLLALPWALTAHQPGPLLQTAGTSGSTDVSDSVSSPGLSSTQIAARVLIVTSFYLASQAGTWCRFHYCP
jgi:hypothetical protein